jgi:16S rRNA (cytosine967-C5)-methyltransferase
VTPAARIQAAIDILDGVIAAARGQGASADRLAAEWFRQRRFVGSKDRRAIRDLVWAAIRACGEVPQSGRAAMLRLAQDDAELAARFDGSTYGPAPIRADEAVAQGGAMPAWLASAMTASGLDGAEQAALLGRAPLDLRANTLKTDRETLAARLPVPATPVGAHGLRLPVGTAAESWPEFAEGLFEVQDAGSQIACEALDVQPGESVVDLCAGAGARRWRWPRRCEHRPPAGLRHRSPAPVAPGPRAERAGALVETRLLNPGQEAAMLADWQGQADAVLVDAPCSGTGTWRRNPEARWRLSAAIARYQQMQAHVLDVAAALVRRAGDCCSSPAR